MLNFIDRRDLNTNVDLVEIGYRIYALRYEFDSPYRLMEGTKIWFKTSRYYLVYNLNVSLPCQTKEELESSILRISDFLRNR